MFSALRIIKNTNLKPLFQKISKKLPMKELYFLTYKQSFATSNEKNDEETITQESITKPTKISKPEFKNLSQIEEYKEGLKYTLEKQYQLAEHYFQKALTKLQQNEELFNIKTSILILKKLALVLKIQEKNNELANILEEIYFTSLCDPEPDHESTHQAFSNLMTHYCLYDAKKGTVFTETVLEEHENNPLPLTQYKGVLFFTGTLDLLISDELNKGIGHLKECIDLKPEPIVRGSTYNNLACGLWWNQNQVLYEEEQRFLEKTKEIKEKTKQEQNELYKKFFEDVETNNLQSVIEESKDIVPYLKRAIKSFEFIYEDDPINYPRSESDKLSPKEFATLSTLLHEGYSDISKIKIDEISFKNSLSSLACMNIGEYLYQQGQLKEAMIWLKIALETSVKSSSMPRVLRSLVVLALIAEEHKKPQLAEKLYIDCLNYLEGMKTYTLCFALEMYSKFLHRMDRKYEADEYYKQYEEFKNSLPSWYERKDSLHIPDYYV